MVLILTVLLGILICGSVAPPLAAQPPALDFAEFQVDTYTSDCDGFESGDLTAWSSSAP